jgi:O-antigen ligase
MIRRLQLAGSVEMIRSIQVWLTTGVLVLAPLFFGSVDQFWIAIWAVLLSIATILGAGAPLNVAQTRVVAAFLSVCFVYAIVVLIQVVPHLPAGFDDPIWRRANELLGADIASRISSTAQIPPIAIGHFLLLVTSFLSGFLAGTSQRNASTLMSSARIAILLYAVYGLIALAVTPDLLLWAPKLAYRGSLTASFVNHNTAATFFGCGVILWSCRTYLAMQSLQTSSLRMLLLNPFNENVTFNVILHASAALTCVFALLLTDSRGGLICSSLGLLVSLGLLAANKFKRRMGYAVACAVLALIALAVWLGKTGRIGSEGAIDDGRWVVYGYSLQAIRQRPWLGAGAGSFENLFPSLRTADFNNWGIWDYAHSTILEIAVEMGLPVAALVVLAACASVFLLVRRALKSDDRNRAALAAITGIAVLTYLHSLIDFSLQIPGYLIVFGILIGCGLAKATGDETTRTRRRSQGIVDFAPTIAEKEMMLKAGLNAQTPGKAD